MIISSNFLKVTKRSLWRTQSLKRRARRSKTLIRLRWRQHKPKCWEWIRSNHRVKSNTKSKTIIERLSFSSGYWSMPRDSWSKSRCVYNRKRLRSSIKCADLKKVICRSLASLRMPSATTSTTSTLDSGRDRASCKASGWRWKRTKPVRIKRKLFIWIKQCRVKINWTKADVPNTAKEAQRKSNPPENDK